MQIMIKAEALHQEKKNKGDKDARWMDYLPEVFKLLLQRASLYNLCIEKQSSHK